jgi:hypothetical protein
MGGQVGRWVAKLVRYRTYLLRQLYGFESKLSQKYKMGDISKGVANTLQPAKKNIQKNIARSWS